MIPLMLAEIVDAVQGFVREAPPPATVRGVSADSRSIQDGELFVAIKGERFDGHRFVIDTFQRGAIAAIVSAAAAEEVLRQRDAHADARVRSATILVVPDTIDALGRLAAAHRRMLPAQVVAVVGSNGKTTTKAMIDHVLAGRFAGRSSPKSFNNNIGVPLTLLSATRADEYLVVEIGTNAPGEVAALAAITDPDMAVLTSIGEEHLELLGDLHGVAVEECSILAALRAGAFAAVNLDAPHVVEFLTRGDITLTRFGTTDDADLRVSGVEFRDGMLHFALNERFPYRLPLVGAHNATNAAAAAAIGRRMGMQHDEIAARLGSFVGPPMRGQVLDVAGVTVINDAYNANPHSVGAAIEALRSFPARGRRLFVLGEMRELGERSAEMHRAVGQRLAEADFDAVVLVGAAADHILDHVPSKTAAAGGGFVRCRGVVECADWLARHASDGDVVWLKASRAVELDRAVELMRTRRGAATAA